MTLQPIGRGFSSRPFMDPGIAEEPHPNFIESNTQAITLDELETKNIVPTFGDNSLTISHQNFTKTIVGAAASIFGNVTTPEMRVSHPINGRIPSAIYKKQSELTDEDKTLYYERMCFVAKSETLKKELNGQEVHLTFVGARSYSEDRLFGRPTPLHFKFAVGWQVRVCSNLMITTNGLVSSCECMTEADLYQKAWQLFSEYKPICEEELNTLGRLKNTYLSEDQFTKIIGRLRLYQFLPRAEQRELPEILLGDQAINAATKGYVQNKNFGRNNPSGDFTCWDLYQLLTEAAKGSYIDLFLSRENNATNFSMGIANALNGHDTEGYSWFLS